MSPEVVVKVGGSLLDLPDLESRLTGWLKNLPMENVLLVPGGGATADVVRDFDRTHRLGEEASHWLALRALTLNAHLLARLLRAEVVDGLWGWDACRQSGSLPVLDVFEFCSTHDTKTVAKSLPHRWAATSDSVAAWVAVTTGARELVLLKSVTLPAVVDWTEAGSRGWVDGCFTDLVRGTPLVVRAVNLRSP